MNYYFCCTSALKQRFFKVFLVRFIVSLASILTLSSCVSTNPYQIPLELNDQDHRYTIPKGYHNRPIGWGGRRHKLLTTALSKTKRLDLPILIKKYSKVNVTSCDYLLDGNIRSPGGKVSVLFLSKDQPALDLDDLIKKDKDHLLLSVGPPIPCPATLAQAKQYLRDNKAGIKQPNLVYFSEFSNKIAKLTELNKGNSEGNTIVGASEHFKLSLVTNKKYTVENASSYFCGFRKLNVQAKKDTDFEIHKEELQTLVSQFIDNTHCKYKKNYLNAISLEGYSGEINPYLLTVHGSASKNDNWQFKPAYIKNKNTKVVPYSCELDKFVNPHNKSPFWLLQHRLRAQLRFGVQILDSGYGRYNEVVEIISLCSDSPLLSGTYSSNRPSDYQQGVITEFQINGRVTKTSKESLIKYAPRDLAEKVMVKRKGKAKITIHTHDIKFLTKRNISMNYDVEAQKQKEVLVQQRFEKRKKEIKNVLTKAKPNKKRITKSNRSIDIQPSTLMPKNVMEKMKSIHQEHKILIDENAYRYNTFLSKGVRYSLDDVITLLNIKLIFQYSESGISTAYDATLFFTDDDGRTFAAQARTDADLYWSPRRFSLTEITKHDVALLKELAIEAQNVKYTSFTLFDSDVKEKHQNYTRIVFDILQKVNPALNEDVFEVFDYVGAPRNILKLLNNDITSLHELYNKTDKTQYYESIKNFDDIYWKLIPLASHTHVKKDKYPRLSDFLSADIAPSNIDIMSQRFKYQNQDIFKAISDELGTVFLPLEYWGYDVNDYYNIYDKISIVKKIFDGSASLRSGDYVNTLIVAYYFTDKHEKCSASMPTPAKFIIQNKETRGSMYGYQQTNVVSEQIFFYDQRFSATFKDVDLQHLIRISRREVNLRGQLAELIARESCDSSVIKQFEENLLRLNRGLPTLQSLYFTTNK